jgi:hypothetical protein
MGNALKYWLWQAKSKNPSNTFWLAKLASMVSGGALAPPAPKLSVNKRKLYVGGE